MIRDIKNGPESVLRDPFTERAAQHEPKTKLVRDSPDGRRIFNGYANSALRSRLIEFLMDARDSNFRLDE